jgi:hypothetical protein
MFGHKSEYVTRGWRRLHNEALHNLYASPNINRLVKLRRLRGVGHVSYMGEMRNAYTVLVRYLEGKRLLRRLRHRWEYNIRIDLRE